MQMAEYKDSYREVVDIAKEAIDIAKAIDRQNDDTIRWLGSCIADNASLRAENVHLRCELKRASKPQRHYDIMHKPHWIKVREGRTYKFECSRCHTDAYCVHYDENKETVCNYRFCPHCGVRMEIEL